MTLEHELEQLSIRPRALREGENRAACPKCDRGPTDTALAVRIDRERAFWICHRCQWTGATGGAAPDARGQSSPLRLPKPCDRSERYALASQMSWDVVARDYVIPGIQRASQAKRLKQIA